MIPDPHFFVLGLVMIAAGAGVLALAVRLINDGHDAVLLGAVAAPLAVSGAVLAICQLFFV